MTDQPDGPDTAMIDEVALDVDGTEFSLRIFADPSGLRGQVFQGEAKVAGVQIYHSTDRERLLAAARANPVVLRAAAAGH